MADQRWTTKPGIFEVNQKLTDLSIRVARIALVQRMRRAAAVLRAVTNVRKPNG